MSGLVSYTFALALALCSLLSITACCPGFDTSWSVFFVMAEDIVTKGVINHVLAGFRVTESPSIDL